MTYRTWQDALAERAAGASGGDGGSMLLTAAPSAQAEEAGPDLSPGSYYYAGPVVDREAGEGPPRCCAKRRVLADKLVWYGGISEEALGRLLEHFPHLAGVARDDLYLCSACICRIMRLGILLPEEMPRR